MRQSSAMVPSVLPARQVDVTLGYVGSALTRRHCGRRTEAVMRQTCSLVRVLAKSVTAISLVE